MDLLIGFVVVDCSSVIHFSVPSLSLASLTRQHLLQLLVT